MTNRFQASTVLYYCKLTKLKLLSSNLKLNDLVNLHLSSNSPTLDPFHSRGSTTHTRLSTAHATRTTIGTSACSIGFCTAHNLSSSCSRKLVTDKTRERVCCGMRQRSPVNSRRLWRDQQAQAVLGARGVSSILQSCLYHRYPRE